MFQAKRMTLQRFQDKNELDMVTGQREAGVASMSSGGGGDEVSEQAAAVVIRSCTGSGSRSLDLTLSGMGRH